MMRSIQDYLIIIPIFIISITLHEAAHAYSAYIFGDSTAKDQGRLTINPLAHLDPFGTIMVLLIGFGWAKPVPVDPRNLREPGWQMPVIAAAGPISNFLIAAAGVVCLLLMARTQSLVFMEEALKLTIYLNLLLMLFNLVPIPPLDGSGVLRGFLPRPWQIQMDEWAPYGSFVLLGLVFLPGVKDVFFDIIYAGMNQVYQFLLFIFGWLA